MVARADFLGRTTEASLRGYYEAGDWLLSKAKELDVYTKPPKALLQGRDLIALGYQPSKKFKEMLDSVYLSQIEGRVRTKEEAIRHITSLEKLSST